MAWLRQSACLLLVPLSWLLERIRWTSGANFDHATPAHHPRRCHLLRRYHCHFGSDHDRHGCDVVSAEQGHRHRRPRSRPRERAERHAGLALRPLLPAHRLVHSLHRIHPWNARDHHDDRDADASWGHHLLRSPPRRPRLRRPRRPRPRRVNAFFIEPHACNCRQDSDRRRPLRRTKLQASAC